MVQMPTNIRTCGAQRRAYCPTRNIEMESHVDAFFTQPFTLFAAVKAEFTLSL
jgi:hypothetical protein